MIFSPTYAISNTSSTSDSPRNPVKGEARVPVCKQPDAELIQCRKCGKVTTSNVHHLKIFSTYLYNVYCISPKGEVYSAQPQPHPPDPATPP